MKLLTLLALTHSISGYDMTDPANEGKKCAAEFDDKVTEGDCFRTITAISGIEFSYHVDIPEGKTVPTFNAHFKLDSAKSSFSSSSRPELRLCIEFGKEGQEYEWREQIAFHAKVSGGEFEMPAKVLAKDWPTKAKSADQKKILRDYRYFCQMNEKESSSGTAIEWRSENQITIDKQSFKQDGSKSAFLDWQRPMVEEGAPDSMDFEPGQTYQAYISYYQGKEEKNSVSKQTSVQGEKGDKDATVSSLTNPKFKKIIINTLAGLAAEEGEDDSPVYTVKASGTRNMISWGSVAMAAAASYASIY